MLALAIILCHALIGGFHTWQQSLSLFFIDALFGFLILPIVRYLVDKIIFIHQNQILWKKNLNSQSFFVFFHKNRNNK